MRRELEYTFQKGDLVKLVSWDTPNQVGRDDVVLGSMNTSEDDPDPILKAGTLCTETMLATRGTLAPWMASVTFGGPDLHTVYIGSLMGHRLPCFRSPVAGLPMVHWPVSS